MKYTSPSPIVSINASDHPDDEEEYGGRDAGLAEHRTLMDGLQFAGQSHSGDWVVVEKLACINLPLFSPTSCSSFICFQQQGGGN